jgi:hypothetical protein
MVSQAMGVFPEDQSRRFAPDLKAARAAFGSDSGYAAAMAAAAVALAAREHAGAQRSALSSGVMRATAACSSASGQFTCTVTDACGTGACRFAAASLSGSAMTAPAPPGRHPRPGNHVRPGEGFGTGPALAALSASFPFMVTTGITSADTARALDRPAA